MDSSFMALALKLAKKGNPSPNPKVGAVVVENGKVIGKGYHKKAGEPHAEVNALQGITAEGATLYVNLEPCSHYGKTPPCTQMIIKSGIKRVVCAMRDPNPLVRGIEELRENGIEVEVGLMEAEARKLNEKFIKHTEKKIPFVTVKCAVSLDGKIASNSGDSKWITNEKSRRYAHRLRGEYDAILVGINTVLQDDPGLRAENENGNEKKDPLRIIVDSTLRTPVDAKVLSDSNVLIATTEQYNREKREILEKKAEIWVCGNQKVDLKELIKKLGREGITSVFIEGGSEVNASAVKEKIVDKFLFFVAPKLITGRNAKGPIGGEGIETMDNIILLKDITVKRFDDDILVEAYPDW
ncbi:MAG: hypothetical protein AYK18_05330 [Theionarchaea archaeon DG-70]|nr:MAG: hypothetical protein AYK18_05330 [Theionarchaea archaeon DG-70]